MSFIVTGVLCRDSESTPAFGNQFSEQEPDHINFLVSLTHIIKEQWYSIGKSHDRELDMMRKVLLNEIPSRFEAIFSCGRTPVVQGGWPYATNTGTVH